MAKRKRPNYYAVRVGRKPGIYDNWDECEDQVSGFSKAYFKGFEKYEDALKFVGDAINTVQTEVEEDDDEPPKSVKDKTPTPFEGSHNMPIKIEDDEDEDEEPMPPPASQSYFDQVSGFVPDNNASFDDEFTRFASSQGFISGSQEYRRERTKAIRDELKFHYSSQPNLQSIPEFPKGEPDELDPLDIYQNMCREIGIEPQDTVAECRRELKKLLVNIIDYIDARRIGRKVKIWKWEDYDAFCAYTLQDEKRIDIREAKADGGFLSALLQRLKGPGRGKRGPRNRGSKKRNTLSLGSGNSELGKRKRGGTEESEFSKRVRIFAL